MTVHGRQGEAAVSRAAAIRGPSSARVAGQLDADLVLSVTARLRGAYSGLAQARLPAARRARWQARLIDISNVAHHDLCGAARQLDCFEEEFRRETAA